MELPSYSDSGLFIVNQNNVFSRVWIIGTCGAVVILLLVNTVSCLV